MTDGPTTVEVKATEQSLQTRIQNETEQVVIAHNYRNEKGQLLVRPDGPISLLPEQEWKMARTKAFKEWFGDWENPDKSETSQIVDSNGEPLLVYHESPVTFEQFDEKFIGKRTDPDSFFGRGFYFHAKNPGKLAGVYGGQYAKVATCFLNIKKPYLYTHQLWEDKTYHRHLLNRDRASALAKVRESLNVDNWKAGLRELEEGKIKKHRNIPQGVDFEEYWNKELLRKIEKYKSTIEQYTNINNHLEAEYEELANYDGVIAANKREELALENTYPEIVAFKKEQILISKWE